MLLKITTVLSGLCLLSAASGILNADTFTQTYSGSLTSTSTVLEETFSLTSASDISITTTSYGGGNNLNGSTTAAGGFQPSLTLYTVSGNYVASQSVTNSSASVDPATGLALDGRLLDSNALPGGYIITLTNWLEQQPPTATNLSDGFINYGGSTFVDVQGNSRSANYGLNLSVSPSAAATPEPTTIGLIALAVLLAGVFGRRAFLNH